MNYMRDRVEKEKGFEIYVCLKLVLIYGLFIGTEKVGLLSFEQEHSKDYGLHLDSHIAKATFL